MYKVIGTTKSRALRVLWMLNELGEPYEQLAFAPVTDLARQHSPTGKLPALIDGSEVLTDSLAILTYLADKHGKLTAPAGTIARAKQDAKALWIIDEIDTVLRLAGRLPEIVPDHHQTEKIESVLKLEFARATQTLSSNLEGEFLMGDTITIPDILACHCLTWAIGAKFPRMGKKSFLYAKALRERPAFRVAFKS